MVLRMKGEKEEVLDVEVKSVIMPDLASMQMCFVTIHF